MCFTDRQDEAMCCQCLCSPRFLVAPEGTCVYNSTTHAHTLMSRGREGGREGGRGGVREGGRERGREGGRERLTMYIT